jgi:hypothetical protein
MQERAIDIVLRAVGPIVGAAAYLPGRPLTRYLRPTRRDRCDDQ